MPDSPKSCLAILANSVVFHLPALTSSTSAHCAREISSFVIRGVDDEGSLAAFIPNGASSPAALKAADRSRKFLRFIICLFVVTNYITPLQGFGFFSHLTQASRNAQPGLMYGAL